MNTFSFVIKLTCFVCTHVFFLMQIYIHNIEEPWQWQVPFCNAPLMKTNPLNQSQSASVLSFLFFFPSLCSGCHLACWRDTALDWQLHPGSQFTGFCERARYANLDSGVTKKTLPLNGIILPQGILSRGMQEIRWVFSPSH